jgi:hypothetical protein
MPERPPLTALKTSPRTISLTVFAACSLWILKFAILEFFRRLNINWNRSYELALLAVRVVLVTTFAAVVISDLVECQPFTHYWQVLPDPGGQCRQGYAQLLTMAICNILTDLLLIIIPVPVILGSSMSRKRKFRLVLLFSLSLAPVAVTIYRVPHIIQDGGGQQARSLYASVELLFATAAANALVLGSFVRDRGLKKRRFKYDSIAAGSLDRSSASEYRRPTATALRHWGSDEDLARELGYGVMPGLQDMQSSPTENPQFRPAPAGKSHEDMNAWQFPSQKRASTEQNEDTRDKMSSNRTGSSATQQSVSFFDHGGLFDDLNPMSPRDSYMSSDQSTSPIALPERTATVPASSSNFRKGSATLLQDLSGFLTPPVFKPAKLKPKPNASTELQPIPQASRETSRSPSVYMHPSGTPDPELMDVGGLLKGHRD